LLRRDSEHEENQQHDTFFAKLADITEQPLTLLTKILLGVCLFLLLFSSIFIGLFAGAQHKLNKGANEPPKPPPSVTQSYTFTRTSTETTVSTTTDVITTTVTAPQPTGTPKSVRLLLLLIYWSLNFYSGRLHLGSVYSSGGFHTFFFGHLL
jgi:endothelin-converting enzyme